MSRLYRGGLNGRVKPADLSRFVFVLDKIRACMEVEIEAAAAAEPPVEPTNINIIEVPASNFFRQVEQIAPGGDRDVLLEHCPDEVPENIDSTQTTEPVEPPVEPEPVDQWIDEEPEIEPEPIYLKKLRERAPIQRSAPLPPKRFPCGM